MTTQEVGVINSSAAASSYNTSAFTPTANALLVCIYYYTGNPTTGSVSDTSGLTWTSRENRTSSFNIAIWTAQAGASPSSTQVTVNTGSGNASGCLAVVFETDEHNDAAPYVQSDSNDTGLASTTPQWTPASALDTDNIYFAAIYQFDNTPTLTPPTNWTETSEVGHVFPSVGQTAQYRVNGESGSTVTWGNTADAAWTSVAIEIAGTPTATTKTITASLSGVLRKQQTLATSLSGALQQQQTASTSLSAFLQEQQLQSIAADLDATIRAIQTQAANLNAILRSSNISATSLSGVLSVIETQASTLNAVLKDTMEQATTLNAALKITGQTKPTTLNARLVGAAATVATLNAILARNFGIAISANAAIQDTFSPALSLDASIRTGFWQKDDEGGGNWGAAGDGSDNWRAVPGVSTTWGKA